MSSRLQRSFKKKKGEFQVIFELDEQEQSLNIKLICQQSLLFYELVIDSHYIKNHKDMSTFFSSPKQLLYTLQALFQDLQIENTGKITLHINFQAAKVNLIKSYVFKMGQWSRGELQYIQRKLAEQQQEYQQKLNEKQSQIQYLQQQKLILQQTINSIDKQKQAYKKQIRQIKEQINEKQSELQELREELSVTKQAKSQLQIQVTVLSSQIQDHLNTSKKMKQRQNYYLQFEKKISSSLSDHNPHLYHFHYKYSMECIKVTKKTENGWSNFISGWPIPQAYFTRFSLKNFKMRDGSLAIGIGSEAVFNNFSLQHFEYISYFCRDGKIYDNGVRRINGTPILSGQAVSINIDRIGSVITWEANEKEIGTANLSSILNSKKLYLIIKVFWKQDEFQLNF